MTHTHIILVRLVRSFAPFVLVSLSNSLLLACFPSSCYFFSFAIIDTLLNFPFSPRLPSSLFFFSSSLLPSPPFSLFPRSSTFLLQNQCCKNKEHAMDKSRYTHVTAMPGTHFRNTHISIGKMYTSITLKRVAI